MPPPRRPTPKQVRPGEPLAFTRALTKRRQWPPTRIRRPDTDVPPAMPYLVVAADAGDDGSRPIARERALHSTAIEVVDAGGSLVEYPTAGVAYGLRVTVRNRGPVAAYAGVAEFFVAGEAFGIEGFLAPAGAAVTVTCRRAWTPADAAAAAGSIVVCAYDALLDRPVARMAPDQDRHVGRRDLLADFAGTWNGLQYFAPGPPGQGYLYRVVVQQSGPSVDVSIFEQVSEVGVGTPIGTAPPRGPLVPVDTVPLDTIPAAGPRGPRGPRGLTTPGPLAPAPVPIGHTLPGVPQLKGTSTVVGNRVHLSLVGLNGQPPQPFTNDEVTLTLIGPNAMHVDQHEEFVDPNDPRGPYDFVADLTR